jgi:hypothetical protein
MVVNLITGFSTERTAEYIILHDLYEKIRDQSSFFYPFFYQRNRDDTNLSAENEVEGLHLIICFARRPKTSVPYSSYSVVTFRQSIFEHVNYFSALGIPSIVGAPIGTGIEEIGFGSKCIWFQLRPREEADYITYEFFDGKISSNQIDDISILDNCRLKEVLKTTHQYKWNEILTLVREWYFYFKATRPTGLFYTIPGQKPVFIAYKIDNS